MVPFPTIASPVLSDNLQDRPFGGVTEPVPLYKRLTRRAFLLAGAVDRPHDAICWLFRRDSGCFWPAAVLEMKQVSAAADGTLADGICPVEQLSLVGFLVKRFSGLV